MNKNTSTTIDNIGGIEPVYDGEGPGWEPLVRRLTAVGKSQGLSVMTVRIVVDEHGCPLYWVKPTACHIEPKAKGEKLEALLLALAGEE